MRKNAKYREMHRKLATELGKTDVPLTQPRQNAVAKAQPRARQPSPSRGEAKLRRRQFVRFYELPDNYVTIEESRRADFHAPKTNPQADNQQTSGGEPVREPYWID